MRESEKNIISKLIRSGQILKQKNVVEPPADRLFNTTKPPGKTLRLILTVVIGFMFFALTVAFLSQSAHFPETNFEYFLFLSAIVCFYTIVLWRLWRRVVIKP